MNDITVDRKIGKQNFPLDLKKKEIIGLFIMRIADGLTIRN